MREEETRALPTLKKIILRERTMRREEETKKLVEEEVEVEIEVRVNWVYVRVSYEDDVLSRALDVHGRGRGRRR